MTSRSDKDKKIKSRESIEKTGREKKVPLGLSDHTKPKETMQLLEEFKDKYLRAHAELDNARKRFIKEKEEYVKYANEDLLSEMIYVVDNFDRALAHMNGTQKVEAILEGINMIRKQFHILLEQKGVKKIESVGKKFDPTLHEAIETVEVDSDRDGIIIEEIQAGYLLKDRLLRPAVVKVGKKIK